MSNHGSMFMTPDGRPGINWKHPYVKIIAGLGIGLVVLTVILIIAVPKNKASNNPNPDDDRDKFRADCLPELSILNQDDEDKCHRRGCIHDSSPNPGQPRCYYPDDYTNYDNINLQVQKYHPDESCTPHTWTLVMKKGKRSTEWPDELAEVTATISIIDESRVRVKIADSEAIRWQVPSPDINSAIKNIQSVKKTCKTLEKALYDLDVAPNGEISVKRRSSGRTIFATDLKKLIFADQFIEVRVQIANNITYGLSEHLEPFAKVANATKKYTIFNNGDPIQREQSLYGSHPFALTYEPYDNNTYDGTANGILLFSSNGMEVTLSPYKVLTYRLIGGIVDFIIFAGPSGRDVLRQKSELIGHPFMPPFWSLGFHICRYGYKNTEHISDVYDRTRAAGIPFDVQWVDIDYMDKRNMFTLNQTNFGDLPQLVQRIHDDKMHFIPILDPAVSGSEDPGTYAPYDEGQELGIFVKDPKDPTKNWEGHVWNEKASIFPDFTHPATSQWWIKHLAQFHQILPFDGLWIDMNEPTTFFPEKDGDCPKDLPNSKYDYPPYPLSLRPAPLDVGKPMFNQTMCLQNEQYLSNHYNLHNMYAYYEAEMSNEALRRIRNKRPFIISRASTTGQGVFGGHWNGDIHSSWDHMKMSIPTLLDFNLYGMPMVGADICGFFDDYEGEMCLRWQQLGAFYPFSRNHNDINQVDQDPAAPGMPEAVTTATRKALQLRYSLLPYLYTLFYKAHKTGDPVMVPMVINYPQDVNTHRIDTQFMWGDSLLITPIVEPNNNNKTRAYFPQDIWYDYSNLKFELNVQKEAHVELEFDLEHMGVFVRGGSIIPWQEPKSQTSHQLESAIRLLVTLDAAGQASGSLYWDDGDTVDPVKYTSADMSFADGKLTYTTKYNLYPLKIDQIIVLQPNGTQAKFNHCQSDKTVCNVTVADGPLIVDVDLNGVENWMVQFDHIETPTTVTEAPPTTPEIPTTTVEPSTETPSSTVEPTTDTAAPDTTAPETSSTTVAPAPETTTNNPPGE